MVKVLVLYDSRTGNTKAMAEEIGKGASEIADVEVKNVDSVSPRDLLKFNAIIIGSPTYYGTMTGKMKEFIDKTITVHDRLDFKVGGAFTSSDGYAGGNETTLFSIITAMMIHNMVIVGAGELNGRYGAVAVGMPNEDDLRRCRKLGYRVSWVAKKLEKP